MACFIVAEAGVNHNGQLDLALELVDVAARAGADAVKFQTFKADNLVKRGTEKADYQKVQTSGGDQHAMIRALELDEDDHVTLARRCVERGIEFMSTPFDSWAMHLLVGLGMRRIKVPSGELTNRPFLEELASQGLPMILSTGMATLDEVERSVAWLREVNHEKDVADWLTILHCTSNYPAVPTDVNLRAMQTIHSVLRVPVGYSDHTLGIEVSLAAVALGASVVEKHFTLNRNLPGPDHQASLTPEHLAEMVRGIRAVEASLGDGVKRPAPSEVSMRKLVRRSAFAARDLAAGAALGPGDLEFLRPGTGIGPEHARELTGRRLQREVAAGAQLTWEDLV